MAALNLFSTLALLLDHGYNRSHLGYCHRCRHLTLPLTRQVETPVVVGRNWSPDSILFGLEVARLLEDPHCYRIGRYGRDRQTTHHYFGLDRRLRNRLRNDRHRCPTLHCYSIRIDDSLLVV